MIIFLNGSSSSGKSTLARHIMHQSERPFLYYSIDHLVNFWIDNFGRLKHSLFNALTNQTFFIEFLPDFERDFRTIIGQAC